MGKEPQRRLLVVELPLEVMEAVGPFFGRASLAVELIDQATAALELLELTPFHAIVVGYPLKDLSLERFIDEVRKPSSNTAEMRILVVAEQRHRADLKRTLGDRVDGLAAPDDDPLTLQQAVSRLLGVTARRSVRYPARVGVEILHDERAIYCRSVDISRAGALLSSAEAPEAGAEVIFQLLIGDRPVVGAARVVRQAKAPIDGTTGFAIRFLRFEDDGEDRLRSYLRDR
jgi:hypothetical protein